MTSIHAWMGRTAAVGLLGATLVSAGGCATVGRMHHGGSGANTEAHLVIPERCGDLSFPVYFESKRAQLTRPARQLITEAGRANRDCRVVRVDVVGLADYRGAAQQNLDISRKRAMAVAKALSSAGFPAPSFGVVAAGASGSVSDEGMPEMMRRRADVTVHYTPAA
jgi:peptidoglycan-associated lipoprotein